MHSSSHTAPVVSNGTRSTIEGRRPKILVLAESLPWPTVKGGDLRTWQNVSLLSSFAEVGVLGLCSNDTRREARHGLPLAFWETSTDPALAQPPPKGIRLEARAWLLDPDGHPSDLYFSSAFAADLEERIDRFRPEIVVVEGLWLHRYIDVIRSSDARTVLDCHNVEAVLARQMAGTDGRSGLEAMVVDRVIPARTKAIEQAALERVDQVWVCSDADAGHLRSLYESQTPVVVVPNSVDLDAYRREPDRTARPQELVTIVYPAFFAHQPNAEAAAFLAQELVPLLDTAGIPYVLRLVGAMPTEAMIAAAACDTRLEVTGTVHDVRPYLVGATVMPVPLFRGSGTRLKILEAFALGVPVVSTSKGAEGLGIDPGVHALVAETAEEFRDAILAVWRDPDFARDLTDAAFALVSSRYSWRAVRPRIEGAIALLADAEGAV